MKQTLMLLFGGQSSEYPVSLQSATAVLEAVDQERYEIMAVGITQAGQWLHCPADAQAIRQDSWQKSGCIPAVLSPSREDHGLWLMRPEGGLRRVVDVAFPVLHGRYGEDGTVQGLLELAGIPCVGCGSLASALCMDKAAAHHLAAAQGVSCPRFVTARGGKPEHEICEQIVQGLQGVALPWFIKPADEGSSFGVTRVESLDALPLAVHTALRYSPKLVAEEGIQGMELGCAVLGNEGLVCGEVDGILLEKGFFDYHEKYTLETAQILLPAPIDAQTSARAKELAQRLYRLFGCRGLARVDMFLDSEGQLYFNEINTIPGFTAHSRYPGMMRAAGMDFKSLVQKILDLAVMK